MNNKLSFSLLLKKKTMIKKNKEIFLPSPWGGVAPNVTGWCKWFRKNPSWEILPLPLRSSSPSLLCRSIVHRVRARWKRGLYRFDGAGQAGRDVNPGRVQHRDELIGLLVETFATTPLQVLVPKAWGPTLRNGLVYLWAHVPQTSLRNQKIRRYLLQQFYWQ